MRVAVACSLLLLCAANLGNVAGDILEEQDGWSTLFEEALADLDMDEGAITDADVPLYGSAADLQTCNPAEIEKVNENTKGKITGSISVDINSGNPSTAVGAFPTFRDGCDREIRNLDGTRVWRGSVIKNTETNGFTFCDKATLSFTGKGTWTSSTNEVQEINVRSFEAVDASTSGYRWSSSRSTRYENGSYTFRDIVINGAPGKTSITDLANVRHSRTLLCSPRRRKIIDVVNSTSYTCRIGVATGSSNRTITWSITSPLRGIPANGVNAFLNFTRPVQWERLLAPKNARRLAIPKGDGRDPGVISTTRLSLGTFTGRLDNQAVISGQVGPFTYPAGTRFNTSLIVEIGATTACRANFTIITPL